MTIVNGVANGAASANGSRIEEAAHDGYFTSAVSVHHKVSLDEGLSLDKECSDFFRHVTSSADSALQPLISKLISKDRHRLLLMMPILLIQLVCHCEVERIRQPERQRGTF